MNPFSSTFLSVITDLSEELFNGYISMVKRTGSYSEVSFISCNSFLLKALSEGESQSCHLQESLVGRFETKNWGSGFKEELENER